MNKTIEFNEELFKKNLKENAYPEDDGYGGLSEEDIEQLKKDGLI